jgi:HK97 family phage major capsid protein
MACTLKELIDERAVANTEATGLIDTADREKRELTTVEAERVDVLIDKVTELSGDIQTRSRDVERREKLAKQGEEIAEFRTKPTKTSESHTPPEDRETDPRKFVEMNFRSDDSLKRFGGRQRCFKIYKDGQNPLPDEDHREAYVRLWKRSSPEYQDAYLRYLMSGKPNERALSAGTSTEGGYLVPTQTLQQLIQAVDDQVLIRQLATVIPNVTGESLGVPTLDTDPDDADWTGEILTGSEDSNMAFGKRELSPWPLAKLIKISKKLLRSAAMDVENIVLQRLAYRFAVPQENGFLTGHGSSQALGVFTASADGISTGRDVSEDNTTTAMTADGLINAKYTLKSQYLANSRWMFHRDGMKQIAKLKDGDGNYIWQPGLTAGVPDRLLGRPVDQSEFSPNTFTTGLYTGILCDWSFYWIADALDIEFQRLVELYAATNQIGIIGRMEVDGMPVLEEAFVRVTLA